MSHSKGVIEIIIILLIIICIIPHLFLIWRTIHECFNDNDDNNDSNSNNDSNNYSNNYSNNDIEMHLTSAIIVPIIEAKEVVILPNIITVV